MFKREKDNGKTNKQLTTTDRDRKDFTDAFNDCWDRLKLNHYYLFNNTDCEILSRRASIVSKDMYTFMVTLFDNMSKHLDADIINFYTDTDGELGSANSDTDTDLDLNYIDVDSPRKKTTKKYSTVDHKIKNEIEDNEDDTDNESTLSSKMKLNTCSIFDELSGGNKLTCVDNKQKQNSIIVDNIYAKKYSYQVNKKKSMETKKRKRESLKEDSVTFKDKVKVVRLMYDNPSLKLEEIKKLSGCNSLENFSQIYKWANQVETQGSQRSIMEVINASVYERYNDNKNIINKNNIDGLLYKWGIEEKKKMFPNRDINFKASNDWIKNFKLVNKINIENDSPKQLTKKIDMVLRVKRLREKEEEDDDVKIINVKKKTPGKKKIRARASFENKQTIVKLANENPDWSIAKLIKMSGVNCVIDEEKIKKWKKDLKNGGSLFDKHKLLNAWVLAKFEEHRKNMIPISSTMIGDWADEGRIELKMPRLESNVSTWVNRFKEKNQVFGDNDDLQRKA